MVETIIGIPAFHGMSTGRLRRWNMGQGGQEKNMLVELQARTQAMPPSMGGPVNMWDISQSPDV